MWFLIRLNIRIVLDMIGGLRHLVVPTKLVLESRHDQPDGSVTFRFRPLRPLHYKAGQYGIWFLPKFIKGKPARLFTIASAPNSGYVELTTKLSGSDFKQKLQALASGESMYILAPFGKFTLQAPQPAVLIAGGIGITPFHAMLTQRDSSLHTDITLVHIGSHGAYAYQSSLSKLVDRTYYGDRDALPQTLTQVCQHSSPQTVFYISGPPLFVKTVMQQLRGLNRTRIRFDGFVGY